MLLVELPGHVWSSGTAQDSQTEGCEFESCVVLFGKARFFLLLPPSSVNGELLKDNMDNIII